ncbi:MAG: KpsF/GutQ family sugar-phosphate isomerase [Kiritimatiellae bacterium]|nr:KpsF/GutQ family sugar-phosphate isomerase [Kiritimatiellia bacterium]MDD5520905.1 KpsF/GutQ family sugar-phosphate isomerase [Kiritimatiellia bacterium]
MNFVKRAQEIINLETQGLKKVRSSLGREFTQAVELILKCLKNRKKIVVTGMGKNLHIAQKISATLASTGSTSVVLNPAQAMHGDLGIINNGDILLALSYSGESEELVMLVPSIKRMDVRIISVTGNRNSALGKCSDVVIPVTIEREACPFNMAPTVSTTVTLAVGDALAMVLLEARGFRKEDYAKLHPGGAIGRSLLLRVSDIMRTGKRIAIIRKGAKVKDALVAMTRARAGSASVLDNRNRLLGIFTDGDLRRHIPKQSNLMNLPIEKVMTRNPVTVTGEELAVDVLKIFEKHNIDDLPVVDNMKRLIGYVDIQDLPKLKIL